ncbi:autophagy-type protein 22 [Abortiporus biennis]|nr:autophagy-type protein 22 [Abortiporus biennis]
MSEYYPVSANEFTMTQLAYNAAKYKRQLRGWLSYAFASEVFVIVSLTLFLPLCLEQFARDNGFLLPDKTQPCSSRPGNETVVVTDEAARCVVKLGWAWIDTASFSLYVNSASVALQALTVISMGGIADHPPHRKRLLLSFAFFGAASAILFLALPSSSPIWPTSALLGIFANVGFGASVVAMNAYIPTLAQDSEDVIQTLHELHEAQINVVPQVVDEPESAGADAPLLPRTLSTDISGNEELTSLHAKYHATLSATTSRISSLGIALGYAAGIILLLLALIPVTKLGGSTFSLRLAIGLSGIWWAVFSLPAAVWLPSAAPPVRDDEHESSNGANRVQEDLDSQAKWNMGREIVNAWKRLGGMLRWQEIKKLRNTFQYLAAWFLLSDGFTTITSTAVLFAKTSLHMPPSSLILIGVITPTSGILGSLVWPIIQRKFGWSNIRILVTLVVMASCIPAYGCLGFLPVFKNGTVKFGGLTTPGEMFALAVYFGSVYGAFQGYARAFYAELIPAGEEARWYGLFSITDKSSSFVGPLAVGLIADMTGNIRYAFFFLVIMVWLAVPILLSIDINRGRRDAREYVYRGSH